MAYSETAAPMLRISAFEKARLGLMRAERLLFALTILAASAILWLAPRLPMIDLPQHAAQVALWRDLLTGQSPWANLVHINLATPYLLGYGLMLPFSFAFSMDVTARIVLTLAFLAFVAACMALRRELDADRRLDWLCLLSFFGFAWKFGFLTFLTASPLALVFVLLAIRHARAPSLPRTAGLVGAGTALLFSHGLLFAAALFLGGLLMLDAAWQNRKSQFAARLAPYLALTAIAIAFRLATQELDGAMKLTGFFYGMPVWDRPASWIISIADLDNKGTPILPLASMAALSTPFLFGCQRNHKTSLVLLFGLLFLLLVLPSTALQTGRIFERFVLFLPPLIAFACRPGNTAPWRGVAATWVLVTATWISLAAQAERVAAFARESAPFETVLKAAEPNKRALAFILDADSPAAATSHVYMHYAAWYQAEKHGFVDFNFALFHPQVVRFRPGMTPRQNAEFAFAPAGFLWSDFDPEIYDYFFVKAEPEAYRQFENGGPCELTQIAQDADWYLVKRGKCHVAGLNLRLEREAAH